MTIAFRQRSVLTEIGPGALLHSLFSTVAVRLEGGQWGERYPLIMSRIYGGHLDQADAVAALVEMEQIRERLARLDPGEVVWDAERPTQAPPWGHTVGPHVTSMANYFVTTTGRNLVNEIIDNLESLRDFGGGLEIVPSGDPNRPLPGTA
ncbi:MAG: Imm70 family immunity protein [Candidatus Dormibacteria bacterium]|jgi:hypothetical protein